MERTWFLWRICLKYAGFEAKYKGDCDIVAWIRDDQLLMKGDKEKALIFWNFIKDNA